MIVLRWPWVSRARLEDALQRLEKSETERKELTERLLAKPEPVVEVAEPAKKEASGSPLPYSTPFDRHAQRFRERNKSDKPVPIARYRVRV